MHGAILLLVLVLVLGCWAASGAVVLEYPYNGATAVVLVLNSVGLLLLRLVMLAANDYYYYY